MDPHSAHSEIAKKQQLYREALARNGFSFGAREIPIARLIAIAPTAAEAKATNDSSRVIRVADHAADLANLD